MRQQSECKSNTEALLETLIKMVGRSNQKSEELAIRIKQLECMLIEIHTDAESGINKDLQLAASQ
ncbi:hypothetical protein [Bacillus infantis]|uniref:Uncharacterized protein n=1 Tax=Bacillus infantis TaxID=324767 RepID=A0A5D4RBR5_9BACI|nr:hypothetical protein [Bacillus infantis]TYS47012.1 hypothetical protein FZD51_16260 [Bacillus infantis]